MPIVRVLHKNRKLLGLGLLGLLAFTSGCDSGGNVGESNVTPTTPPPGAMTGDAVKDARLKGLGTTGDPGKPKPERKSQ
jgi:hypothetical protein